MEEEKEDLTFEKLKKYPGFENVTEKEAEISIDIFR